MSTTREETEKEPLEPSRPAALDYLLSIVRDPEADAKRRDQAAVAIASLSRTPRPVVVTNGKAGSNAPVIADSLTDELVENLVRQVVLLVREENKPLAARLGSLEQQAVKYRGIWNEEETYSAGTMVTFQGGLWHCTDTNCGVRPGSGSSSWTLANKSRR
jgi:hypothetical protein